MKDIRKANEAPLSKVKFPPWYVKRYVFQKFAGINELRVRKGPSSLECRFFPVSDEPRILDSVEKSKYPLEMGRYPASADTQKNKEEIIGRHRDLFS
jgi:hypothetical protein